MLPVKVTSNWSTNFLYTEVAFPEVEMVLVTMPSWNLVLHPTTKSDLLSGAILNSANKFKRRLGRLITPIKNFSCGCIGLY